MKQEKCTIRNKENFRNHIVIGNHHTDRTEQTFQVIGELLPSLVTGVDREEDPEFLVQFYIMFAQEHFPIILFQAHHNRLDLLGNHRKHLQLNTIELIQARPAAGLAHAAEELPHGFEVDAFRAVEDETLDLDGFGQVFDRLGLPSTCRARGVPPVVKLERVGHRQVAFFLQGRNDQPVRVAQVLVAHFRAPEHLLRHDRACLFVHEEGQLLLPVEIVRVLDVLEL